MNIAPYIVLGLLFGALLLWLTLGWLLLLTSTHIPISPPTVNITMLAGRWLSATAHFLHSPMPPFPVLAIRSIYVSIDRGTGGFDRRA
jgi:hypothetical protein